MRISGKIHIHSVSELTETLKRKLETEYRFVHIQGEVSNLRRPFSGHLYFSLKDHSAQIKAVLFKGQKKYLSAEIEDGQHIICHGRISVYAPRGEYQIIVDTVDHYGAGLLQMQFEQLKQRLAQEGLFDSERKKPLPPFPRDLAVITSPTGAALFDFLKIADMRRTFTKILVYPVRVQGKGAAEEIAAAVRRLNRDIRPDILVLCRGGGSIEDLQAFNEEVVARAIFDSRVPVVTGVGHETDTTIADYCADMRAPTPTGAAELLFRDGGQAQAHVAAMKRRLASRITSLLEERELRVRQSARLLGDMDSVFIPLSLRLDMQITRIFEKVQGILQRRTARLHALKMRLEMQPPTTRLKMQEQRLNFAVERIHGHIRERVERKRAELARHMGRLEAVSPLSTLARGYSLVSKKGVGARKGAFITKSGQVEVGEEMDIRLHEGGLECRVMRKRQTH